MAVTVVGKNYTQISSCDSAAAGGTWLILTTLDPDTKKEGTNALCGIVKTAGDNVITFTPTSAVDLSGVKHLRFWFISTHGGILNTYALNGLNFWVSTDGGVTKGYWKILGKDTYPGGWVNCVIDVSKNCDSGTKPAAMNAITSMGLRINLTVAGKNVANTWIDNLCVCDGLVVYGDDVGGYFDLDDIFLKDDATTGGWGILKKIGGIYYAVGSLEIGYATSATKFQTKSSVMVFENRRVNDALYSIYAVDSGNASYTTEFIFGSKSGTAGIEGCMIRTQDLAQTCKFLINGAGANVDNFKLYGTTFFDASTISLPPNSANVEVLNCAFEGCSELLADTCVMTNCNFISSAGRAVRISSASHNVTSCNFINCQTAIHHNVCGPTGTHAHYDYSSLMFTGGTYHIENSAVTPNFYIDIDRIGTPVSNPDPAKINNSNGGSTTLLEIGVPLEINGVKTGTEPSNYVRCRIEKQSDGSTIMNQEAQTSYGTEGFYKATMTYSYTTEVPVRVKARYKGYLPFEANATIKSTGMTVTAIWQTDPNYAP